MNDHDQSTTRGTAAPGSGESTWPTYGEVGRAKWPKSGFPLPDGRRVIEYRQAPADRQGGPMIGHLCLDDGTCRSGRITKRVRHGR